MTAPWDDDLDNLNDEDVLRILGQVLATDPASVRAGQLRLGLRQAGLDLNDDDRRLVEVFARTLSPTFYATLRRWLSAGRLWTRYHVGDLDPTLADVPPKDWCGVVGPGGHECTWTTAAHDPTWHVAGRGPGATVAEVWPVESFTASTGVMDQGPAGPPVTPAGPSLGDDPDGDLDERAWLVAARESDRARHASGEMTPASFVAAFERLHQTPQPEVAPPAEVEFHGADEADWRRRMDTYGIDTADRTFGVSAADALRRDRTFGTSTGLDAI